MRQGPWPRKVIIMKQIRPELTAIARTKLSQPMKYLNDNSLIKGRSLDYGCGKGFDADDLGMYKYDPFHFSSEPWLSQINPYSFETVTCNYVLNVIQDETDLIECIKSVQSLLTQNGTAYISVRRDVKHAYVSKRNTYQRPVYLNLRSIKKTSHYEIYVLDKTTDLNKIKVSHIKTGEVS